jgi:hypothetical protein
MAINSIVGDDAVFGAEIQHFLGLLEAALRANAGKASAHRRESAGREVMWDRKRHNRRF